MKPYKQQNKTLYDLDSEKIFLTMTLKSRCNGKTNKFDYVKAKQNENQLLSVKIHDKQSQRHRVTWEEILATQSTWKSLIILIHKELSKLRAKPQNSCRKSKRLEQTIPKNNKNSFRQVKDVQLHAKKEKKNENYTLVKYDFTPIRVAKIRSLIVDTVHSVGKAMGKRTPIDTCGKTEWDNLYEGQFPCML